MCNDRAISGKQKREKGIKAARQQGNEAKRMKAMKA